MSPRDPSAPRLASLLAWTAVGAPAQSVLRPAGVQAARIADWWNVLLFLTATVWIVLTAVIVAALARRARRAHEPLPEPFHPSPRGEHRRGAIVGGAVVGSAILLVAVAIGDFVIRGDLRSLSDQGALQIRVTGHQWWWEFQYQDSVPSHIVTSPNVLHLPVGKVAHLELRSADVIHSFWVPSLHGKKDLIPGHESHLDLRADRAGTYVGQCAEFCGHQHATMRFLVIAEPEDRFQLWLAAQREPAVAPASATAMHGQAVFMTATCVMCHSIQGTPAGSHVGPDLTHVAGRPMIAAATLPNTRGALAGWIVDPQGLRPGVRMPPNPLPPRDLQALLDYLETLK